MIHHRFHLSQIKKSESNSFKFISEQLENNSEREFLTILKNLGGWPVLEGESWKEENFDWKKSIQKFDKTGYSDSYFLSYSIEAAMKNNSYRMIFVSFTQSFKLFLQNLFFLVSKSLRTLTL